ncbi:glyoxylase-like metal-dependent hydrolase (beta-lactamase superfamily II) [Microbacterium sp. AG790]|uniref:MBL fold metallo-hydrolase n=1 Tax=Microbacterium sp. AG790 TaxID=2183995 RepID=UPI000EACAA02|nr:MBL fold metallo-hydrolase [Microbacterium sp. AG790]RKS86746.1 glyoxylase-like metal-dependent hydrolase (beta-lactamase superfamily II) [Microbacterium sp. AG790]
MPGRSTARVADVVAVDAAQPDAWLRGDRPPTVELSPGVWAVPVPCEMFPVRFTYAYLVVDGSDAVVIDPGLDTPAGMDALRAGAADAGLDLGNLTRILVTHYHPDHLGMAARLRDLSGARVSVHASEGAFLADMIDRPPEVAAESEMRWLVAVDAGPDLVRALREQSHAVGALLRVQLCLPDDHLRDGDIVAVGSRRLVAVHTPGHTSGHLCFVDPEAKLLFTGDHILPTINPNVGLHRASDDGDPLGDYLVALERLRAFADHVVLPGHEYAFTGLGDRIDALRGHQTVRSEALTSVLRQRGPCSVSQAAAALTWSRSWEAMSVADRHLALATVFAHVRRLEARGLVAVVSTDPTRYGLVS